VSPRGRGNLSPETRKNDKEKEIMLSSLCVRKRFGAFTLIELLIVVAILAILAAIATPNFLEAQMRAKVARVRADSRTLATAMESYALDNVAYPFCDPQQNHSYLSDIPGLTTPVAYMQNLLPDVFPAEDADARTRYYRYYPVDYWQYAYPQLRGFWRWIVMSNGPDRKIDITRENAQSAILGDLWMVYDPTNGVRSQGDVILTNRGFLGNTM